jgi:hypothetical protein
VDRTYLEEGMPSSVHYSPMEGCKRFHNISIIPVRKKEDDSIRHVKQNRIHGLIQTHYLTHTCGKLRFKGKRITFSHKAECFVAKQRRSPPSYDCSHKLLCGRFEPKFGGKAHKNPPSDHFNLMDDTTFFLLLQKNYGRK